MGREMVIKNNYVLNISKLIDDRISKIRLNSYNSMINLAGNPDGVDHMLTTKILDQLVDKIIEEKVDEILVKVLQLMKLLLYGGKAAEQILNTQAIPRLTALLENFNSDVKDLLNRS
jgi:hypothetical protein